MLNINFIEKNNLKDPFDIKENIFAIRWTNTTSWNKYFNLNYFDKSKIIFLDKNDYKVEKFMLSLRTKRGINNIEDYIDILVDNWQDKAVDYINKKLINLSENKLKLTSK